MNCSHTVYVQIERVESRLKFLQLFEELPCSLLIHITPENDGRATSLGLDCHLKLIEITDAHWTARSEWIMAGHEGVPVRILSGFP